MASSVKTDVVCVGQACVDVLLQGLDLSAPFEGEFKFIRSTAVGVGGDATNQAIVLAKLGLKSKLICKAGNDGAGVFLRDAVAGSGADVSGIVRGEAPTWVNVIVVSPDGQRNFITPPFEEIIRFEPDREALKDSRVVSLASLLLPPFVSRESVERVARPAKERGSIVCADVIAYEKICRFEDLYPALPYIDYLFPNEEEAARLTRKDDLDGAADALLRAGVGNVVIKTGSRGCFLKNKDARMTVPAFDVPVADTTGAGDNFASGFMLALLEGRSLPDCCRYANAAAGLAVRSVGANTGVQSRAQVEEFLASGL